MHSPKPSEYRHTHTETHTLTHTQRDTHTHTADECLKNGNKEEKLTKGAFCCFQPTLHATVSLTDLCDVIEQHRCVSSCRRRDQMCPSPFYEKTSFTMQNIFFDLVGFLSCVWVLELDAVLKLTKEIWKLLLNTTGQHVLLCFIYSSSLVSCHKRLQPCCLDECFSGKLPSAGPRFKELTFAAKTVCVTCLGDVCKL